VLQDGAVSAISAIPPTVYFVACVFSLSSASFHVRGYSAAARGVSS